MLEPEPEPEPDEAELDCAGAAEDGEDAGAEDAGAEDAAAGELEAGAGAANLLPAAEEAGAELADVLVVQESEPQDLGVSQAPCVFTSAVVVAAWA